MFDTQSNTRPPPPWPPPPSTPSRKDQHVQQPSGPLGESLIMEQNAEPGFLEQFPANRSQLLYHHTLYYSDHSKSA